VEYTAITDLNILFNLQTQFILVFINKDVCVY